LDDIGIIAITGRVMMGRDGAVVGGTNLFRGRTSLFAVSRLLIVSRLPGFFRPLVGRTSCILAAKSYRRL